jgi:hypothetical protein
MSVVNEMGLMSYIHRHLLKRGRLSDFLPGKDDLIDGNRKELDEIKAEMKVRISEEREIDKEVSATIVRLNKLDSRNHYGESLRRAFGGR